MNENSHWSRSKGVRSFNKHLSECPLSSSLQLTVSFSFSRRQQTRWCARCTTTWLYPTWTTPHRTQGRACSGSATSPSTDSWQTRPEPPASWTTSRVLWWLWRKPSYLPPELSSSPSTALIADSLTASRRHRGIGTLMTKSARTA